MNSTQANVSVVIPVRDGAATIEASILSALHSSRVLEIIVVDDGSIDATVSVVEAVADSRVRVLQRPPSGIPQTLNVGFDHVQGDFIVRCDADDQLVDGALEIQARFLETHPDYVAVCGQHYVEHTETGVSVVQPGLNTSTDVDSELRAGVISTHFGSWLTRYSAIEAIGGARNWFVTSQDLDLQYRIAFQGKIRYLPFKFYNYNLHDSSISHSSMNSRRIFYKQHAQKFCLQRAATGSDDLELGRAPAYVDLGDDCSHMTAASRTAGLLEGAAWRKLKDAQPREATRLMLHSLRMQPLSWRRWRSLGVLGFRSAAIMLRNAAF